MDSYYDITNLSILIVDDEPNIRKTLSYCLKSEGHTVFAVSNIGDAVDAIKRHSFDMAFVDLKLKGENGLDLIPLLLIEAPWLKVVVITAYGTIETAVEAMKRGAADYIAKPFSPDQVRLIVKKISELRKIEQELAFLKEDIRRIDPDHEFQSKNVGMQKVMEMAYKSAASEAIILLRGDSGTGKTVLAREIHRRSPRADKPIAIISCPSIPSELLESELFGHIKGAFTGAIRDNPGRIAMCEGGTLFLDEIAEMAPSVQAKLLRFIQEREYERIGDPVTRSANIRIIIATNAELEKRVSENRFREDLFYRINVISLTLPSLCERSEDIMPLASNFLCFFCRVNHKVCHGFTEEATQALQKYQWPGNIRELRNVIERAVILGSGELIGIKDLPETVLPSSGSPAIGDQVSLAAIEELHIRRIIASTSSLQEAADILGIDQATLWRRRKTYNI